MTIIEFLSVENVRITFEDRWVVVNAGEFIVYQRKFGKRNTQTLYRGLDEEKAVQVLWAGEAE